VLKDLAKIVGISLSVLLFYTPFFESLILRYFPKTRARLRLRDLALIPAAFVVAYVLSVMAYLMIRSGPHVVLSHFRH
jgi:hypothetical protein